MKTLYKILGLAVIDFALIWIWVYQMDPDPSVSIGIIFLVPFVFILNLIVAGILFFAKKKEYSKVFLVNSVVSSIIMFYLFGRGIDRYQNKRLEEWVFKKADTTFSLIRWKETNKFNMTYSLNPGSSWGLLDGICVNENGKWILKTDSITMKIDKDNLIGLRNLLDTIKMKKEER
ncbi:hypothetical protein QWZ06_03185 [Chryseobacterium tructae]|uniref:Uncharacterized protein n=1 Tax=Chryseobacterium tructae TaxID=1037380 RepID=A0ABV7XT18_9FLAO|nr:hypothetical protein [Chryseobacterium tructae]MDN3691334.1 hypothetical protein [Chryseobacterium tructae]